MESAPVNWRFLGEPSCPLWLAVFPYIVWISKLRHKYQQAMLR